jgi:hypothetical protein
MKKLLILLLICLSPASGFDPGKKNTRKARTHDGSVVSREKRADEILVVGSGNLKFKGSFYLQKGTGIKFFYGVCGGHGGKGDFGGGPPASLKITRVVDGKQKIFEMKYRDLHLAKTPDFELLDGDRVFANARIF